MSFLGSDWQTSLTISLYLSQKAPSLFNQFPLFLRVLHALLLLTRHFTQNLRVKRALLRYLVELKLQGNVFERVLHIQPNVLHFSRATPLHLHSLINLQMSTQSLQTSLPHFLYHNLHQTRHGVVPPLRRFFPQVKQTIVIHTLNGNGSTLGVPLLSEQLDPFVLLGY